MCVCVCVDRGQRQGFWRQRSVNVYYESRPRIRRYIFRGTQHRCNIFGPLFSRQPRLFILREYNTTILNCYLYIIIDILIIEENRGVYKGKENYI